METKRKGYMNHLINLSLREKIILTISIILFLFLIFYIGMLKPISNSMASTNNNIKALNSEKEKLSKENNNSNTVATNIYYANEKLKDLKGEIPKDENQVGLLNSIMSIETQSNVQVGKIAFLNEGKSSDNSLKIYGANISVTGNYNQVLQFINLLEQNKRKLQIKEVNIVKNEKKYNGQISLNYFSLNNEGK